MTVIKNELVHNKMKLLFREHLRCYVHAMRSVHRRSGVCEARGLRGGLGNGEWQMEVKSKFLCTGRHAVSFIGKMHRLNS